MTTPPPVIELTGVVAARPDDVWPLLVEARRREGVEVTVDDDQHRLEVEGQWWYGGSDVVTSHERGALVTHTVHNRASGASRLVARLVQVRSARRSADREFEFLLGSIGQRLGCATWYPAADAG